MNLSTKNAVGCWTLTIIHIQGRSQRWGRGDSPPPTRDSCPARTFTGLITEGQLEHYGMHINTEEKINGSTKEKYKKHQ